METHGNSPLELRKEIRCRDCGHGYSVGIGQRSSRCSACGNVAFHAESEGAAFLAGAVLSRVESRLPQREPEANPLAAFAQPADGLAVNQLLHRYQVEWQLWAMLVKNFADPIYHAAYLAQVLQSRALDQAARRYREHRSVMALSTDSLWQAEVADLMLGRIESLTAMAMAAEGRGGLRWPEWVLRLPLESRVFRVGWIALGLVGTAKIFGLV